tara:strand:- start:361 stop:1737 length:1377 start_codon:yes stop_codon:yes gene_type:complete
MRNSLFFLSLITLFFQSPLHGNNDVTELVEDTAPAVVNITSKREVSLRANNYFRGIPEEFERFFGIPRDFNPEPRTRESVAYGSGFFYKDNFLLTNYHVVNDATEVIVSLNDRREFVAEVVGVDMLSDIAVLKIEGDKLPSLRMGKSKRLKVGESVIAIGSPFSFDFSVTAGIVSAKGRSIQNQNIGNYVPFIQTDVAINPGNSGGPLFNLDGEVVGINSQIYSRSGAYQGVSFAIPIDVAIEVAEQIINKGEVSRGYLGVRMSEVDSDLAQALGMEKPYGALINSIEKDQSADNADLKAGDVIIEFNGEEVKFAGDLPHIVGRLEPGSQANAQIIRNGKEITLEFTLGKLENAQASFTPAKSETSNNPIGLQVENLSDATDEIDHGVAVSTVDSDSASSGKIFEGDIITDIQAGFQRFKVEDAKDFNEIIKKFETGDKIAIFGYRDNSRFIVPITVK